jgi:hypothetical protein
MCCTSAQTHLENELPGAIAISSADLGSVTRLEIEARNENEEEKSSPLRRRTVAQTTEGSEGMWTLTEAPTLGVFFTASTRSPFLDPKRQAESSPMRQSRLWRLW